MNKNSNVIPDMIKTIKKRLDELNEMELHVEGVIELYDTLKGIQSELGCLTLTDKRHKF